MAKFFRKNNLTKIDFFSIIDITAKTFSCTCKRSSYMKVILSLLIMMSSNAFADWSGVLGNSISTLTATAAQSAAAILEAKNKLTDECGIEPSDCLISLGIEDSTKCASLDNSYTKMCCSLCKSYNRLKSSAGINATTIGSLLGLAAQLGGELLAPGCESDCKSYSGNDQIRCYCSHVGKDGKPCKEPTSSECKKASEETCEEQMAKLGITDPVLLAACNCGKKNEVDPRKGWYLNNSSVCVNDNNSNNNNNTTTGNTFDPEYEKTAVPTTAGDNNNNSAAAATAATTPTAASPSAMASGASGSKDLASGNNNKKDKSSPFTDTGHGAGRASNAMAGGYDASGRGGNSLDFKVKKGEKVKDIAKSDGEDLFKLVSTVYKTQIEANALDSTRAMKKIDRKEIDKKATGKKTAGRKG